MNELRYGIAVAVHGGENKPADGVRPKKIADAVPQEWEVVRIDLWEFFKQPMRVQGLRIISVIITRLAAPCDGAERRPEHEREL